MINTVETFDGSIASKRDCRFIKGEFYIKNKQCFLIGGTWYRINSGFITFDHEKQVWVITKDTPGLIKGIIGYDTDKNEAILGLYTPNPYKNVRVLVNASTEYNCIDFRMLPVNLFVEDSARMMFVRKGLAISKETVPSVNFGSNGYPYQLPYCTKHYPEDLYKRFMEEARGNGITTNIGKQYSELGAYSFGFEFETNRGKVPNYRILESGLLPLRDGSISGIEFATIPLSGRKGVEILENACDNLKKYTAFTENESLHLHIGNIPTSKKFIGALYTMCCILEKDIFSLFPAYYDKTSKFKAKAKDYNMPLRKELVALTPEETFNNVAFYLSEGKKFQGFGSNHPSDPEGHAKWNIQARYHLINFIPLIFGANNTLEFRCHVPTRDKVKVLNWLFICSAIIKYTEKLVKNNVDLNTCRATTLSDVVKDIYSHRLGVYLRNYIGKRQGNRALDVSNGDFVGKFEINAELKGNDLYEDMV
jgi:hypothetical protein